MLGAGTAINSHVSSHAICLFLRSFFFFLLRRSGIHIMHGLCADSLLVFTLQDAELRDACYKRVPSCPAGLPPCSVEIQPYKAP